MKLFIICFLFFSCFKAKKAPLDLTRSNTTLSSLLTTLLRPTSTTTSTTPVVPASGTIGVGVKTHTTLTILLSPPTGMSGTVEYRIFASYPDVWTTISEVEANAIEKLPYTPNLTSYQITGLEPYQFYRIDIIAKDNNDTKILFPYFCVQMDPNISGTVTCSTGPKGIVTTLVGTGSSGSNDGNFSVASFNQPTSMTTIGNTIYLTDTTNHTIRSLNLTTQVVSTVAGLALSTGYVNAIGTSARFFTPMGITTDGSNLFVTDRSNQVIRLVNPLTGSVSTVVGPATTMAGAFADGSGTSVRFNSPNSIIYNGTDIYISDEDNCRIRKMTLVGVVSTHAGNFSCGNSNGSLLTATFSANMTYINFARNFLLLTDFGNNNIRKIDVNPSGNVSNLLNITSPRAILAYGKFIYISETNTHKIIKFNSETNTQTDFVGTGSSGSNDGTGVNASFNFPNSMIFIGNTLYVIDTNNHKVRKIE